MAPTPDDLSSAGSVSYDSETMTVGDGTWDFSKNTFLLPNLQGVNFDTMRYNGMGNRFSTLTQYHKIILGHAILAAIVFLLLAPSAIMVLRFYTGRPGYALRYHARIQTVGLILLTASFILGNIAVGPARSLTNPHHGIGVALYVLYTVQFFASRLVFRIQKAHSLRVTLHQWIGRGMALLGMAQVPLGLTLYGCREYLFILYAVWMALLVVVYFVLDFRAGTRRELLLSGPPRSEAGHTRVSDSEYFSERPEREHGSRWKWLGPLAGAGAVWMLLRGGRRNKDKDADSSSYRSHSPSHRSRSRSRSDRRGSPSYYDSEKYTEMSTSRREKGGGGGGGGGMMKLLGGAAAAFGAGKLFSNYMDRRRGQRDDEEYSAVSTETPRRHRSGRSAGQSMLTSDYDSELASDVRGDPTRTSLLSESIPPSAMAGAISAATPRPKASRPPPARFNRGRRNSFEESEYVSYVSPSSRPVDDYDDESHHHHAGAKSAGGVLGGIGLGWLSKKWMDRRSRKDEERRLQEEEDMRSGVSGSRFTGDGYPSPTRRPSKRPSARPTSSRPTQSAPTDMTESSYLDDETAGPSYVGPRPTGPVPLPGGRRDRSRSRRRHEPVSMPAMPPDPDLQSDMGSSYVTEARPQRRDSSRRRRAGERATAAAAARASELAADQERERERFGSPHSSRPLSVTLKMHDDRDRNVTLRRLTDEEARAARGPRGRSRADSDGSISGMDSPSYGRSRYRRQASRAGSRQTSRPGSRQTSRAVSRQRSEMASESRVESRPPSSRPPSSRRPRDRGDDDDDDDDDDEDDEDDEDDDDEGQQSTIGPLSPPNPASAKPGSGGRRAGGKDSAYYSGNPAAAAGPSETSAPLVPSAAGADQTVSSLASHDESHGTWSQMTPSLGGDGGDQTAPGSAADNRRRRRLERRRGSSSRPTTATDMFD
ncbi:hypothetical protein GMORB2_6611 [Geosmithia morbida]|uniref:Cytochrome b561 domain-containing protein n=1 Tax=Geosmithia morbida TaxID=1094350 RepID=A0A9P5D0T2_9HYPO|nr:uncharacterized protein GMORB2_6611 [Geosmithia morbida]KAF4123063.1 hypothetical protein GMORB2_6611 [Geosmithia morbida]